MKRLFKLLLVSAVVIIVLITAPLVALKIIFPAEKIKLMAQNYVKTNYNREISFDGVSFNLIGVGVNNFALSEAATFKEGAFVSAGKAVVKIALKPLFKKQIEIKTIGLEDVTINIAKEQNGKFNFDDLTAAFGGESAQRQPAAVKAAAPVGALALVADNIYIKNAAVNYKDKQSDMRFNVQGFNFNINNFTLDKEFLFSGSFATALETAGLKIAPVNFEFNGAANVADMALERAYLNLDNFSAVYKNFKARLSGGINNFDAPAVTLNGEITGIDNNLAQEFAGAQLPKFALPKITLAAQINADIKAAAANIADMRAYIGNSYVKTAGSVNYGGPALKYNTNTDIALSLKEIASIAADTLAPFKLAGDITGHLAVSDGKNLPNVKGSLTLKDIGALVMQRELKNLNGAVAINSIDDIKTNLFKGVFDSSKFSASLAYAKPAEAMNVNFLFDMDEFKLDDISLDVLFAPAAIGQSAPAAQPHAAAFVMPGPRSAPVNVKADITVRKIDNNMFVTQNLKLKADIKGLDNKLDKATGSAEFSTQNGEIRDLDKLMNTSKVLRVMLASLQIAQNAFKTLKLDMGGLQEGRIAYNSIEGAYALKAGSVNISKTDINADVATIKTGGSLNLLTTALNMKIQSHLGKIGSSGFKPVVINVSGTIDKPSVKLDAASTITSVLGVSKDKTARENAAAVKESVQDTADKLKEIAGQIGHAIKK
ncbi:MAG: AsmA family protein [Elusimicrobiota bacterium]|jgi:AsmA protein|nr:AsmA family protein [Elusimicrobiota bacterium]